MKDKELQPKTTANRPMVIRFRKLTPEAVKPTKATGYSAAFDLTANKVTIDTTADGLVRYTVHTGIAVEIPEGYYGDLRSRSSVCKTGLILSNGCGVIDADYRGEIKAVFYLTSHDGAAAYEAGERCLQLLISPVPDVEFEEADELTVTLRGEGGYGSTGK